MYSFRNEIVVDAPIEKAFQVTCDVKIWPEIVKDCISVDVLEDRGDEMLTETTSRVNNVLTRQRTIRRLRTNERMEFEHIKTPFPLKTNEGEWVLTPTGEGVEISLTHRIRTVFPSFLDYFASRFIARFFIEKESRIALEGIKRKIEAA